MVFKVNSVESLYYKEAQENKVRGLRGVWATPRTKVQKRGEVAEKKKRGGKGRRLDTHTADREWRGMEGTHSPKLKKTR